MPIVNRRAVLKGAAASTGVLAAPGLVTRALASSGEINILMWSDYLPDEFVAAFEAETGIKINYTKIGSNEEIIDRMKATRGRLYDLVAPTNFRSPQWQPLGLLQPFDMNRVPVDRVNPAMAKIGEAAWNFDGKGVHWLPHIWGTEGIGWRTDKWTPGPEGPSYGDVWSDAAKGEWGRAQVVWKLRAPTAPGTYPITAAYWYGTEKASPLGVTEHPVRGKRLRGGSSGGSGRVVFSEPIGVVVQ